MKRGENVNIALTVKNGNIYGIDNVKSEIGLPDGLTLKKGELADGEYTLAAGQSRSNEITAYIEKASKPGDTTDPVNPGNPETDGSLCPLWLTLSILSGGTLAVLGIKKKCGKGFFTVLMRCDLADSASDRCICRRGHNAECKRKRYGK